MTVVPATIAFPERLQDPQLKEDFGPQIWEEVQNSFKDWHRLPYFQPLIGIGDTARQIYFGERGSIEQWVTSGAVVVMGTDSGTPTNFNTEALWREIKTFVDYGMSPLRAISAATRIPARVMGRGADLGTIEPGKLADIIVLKRNPLYDIQALADVRGRREGRCHPEGCPAGAAPHVVAVVLRSAHLFVAHVPHIDRWPALSSTRR